MYKKVGILVKVLVPIIILIALAMGSSTWVAYDKSRDAMNDSVREQMNVLADSLTDQMQAWMDRNILDLKILSQEESFGKAFETTFMGKSARKNATKRLGELVKNFDVFESLNLANQEGDIIASSHKELIGNIKLSDREYFQKAIAGDLAFSEVIKSRATGKPIFVIALPVQGNGDNKGVFYGVLKLSAFNQRFIEPVHVAKTGYSYLINQKGICIAHPDPEQILKTDISKDEFGQQILREKNGIVNYTWEGVEKLAAFREYKQKGWFFIITAPVDEVHGTVYEIRNLQIGIALFGMFVIGVGVWLMIKFIMIKPVTNISEMLKEASVQVNSGSSQISVSSQTLAEGSSEQAASIEETSSSLEEMASMTRQNADNANLANETSQESQARFEVANNAMRELTASMEEIVQASAETQKIVKTIDEIAFQTNLLALNAAVEAARAGEAGAGFAVVADEVRNLALRAAQASRNTASLIEETVTKVKSGVDLVAQADRAFSNAAEDSRKMGALVSEIAAASVEQAQGIDQVNQAVADMDKVTQKNAATAEESASASEEMNAQAAQLLEVVAQLNRIIGGNLNTRMGEDFGRNTSKDSDEAHHLYEPLEHPIDRTQAALSDSFIK